MKLKANHEWSRLVRIAKGVRILRKCDRAYGTAVSFQNLRNAEGDLRIARKERWK